MNLKYFTEITSDIAICITALVAIVTAIITIWQLKLMREGFKADHERRRKQVTIEFYRSIRDECAGFMKQINEKFPNGKVINACDVKNDMAILKIIREYLSRMEILSVGVNINIYDIATFDRMAGASTIRSFERLKEVIVFRRETRNAPYLYGDFEKLILELIKLRGERFPKHDKDFAKMKHNFV
jgi:hypothetical protein